MNRSNHSRRPTTQSTVLMLRAPHSGCCVGCGRKLGAHPRRAGAKFRDGITVDMMLCSDCSSELALRGELHTRLQRTARDVATLYRTAPAGHA